MYQVGEDGVAISDCVHRGLNDIVLRMTEGRVSGWQNNYEIFIGLDGEVKGKPIDRANLGFESGFTRKIVFLPTPQWVRGSNQRICICFSYELPNMMREWWEEYSKCLR